MKRRLRGTWTLTMLLAALATAGVIGCGDSEGDSASTGASTSAPTDDSPIVIGAAQGLSGFMEAYDVPVLRAAEFAVEDINEQGGVLGRPLKIISADYHSKVDESGPVARGLLDQDAKLLITACDFDLGSPAALVAEEKGVPAFSCAGSIQYGVQGIGPHAYTLATPGRSEGAAMAEFAVNEKGIKTAWTLRDTTLLYYDEVCKGFTARFKELGGTVVGAETFTTGDASISTQIDKLRSAQAPEALFLCALPTGGAGAMRQLRAAGFDQLILSSNTYDGDFWKGAVPDISNVIFTTFGSLYGDDPDDKVNALIKRYTDKYGKRPDSSILIAGYSMIEAFKLAAEKAGSVEGDAVVKALDTMGPLPLLIGQTTFSPDLHVDLSRRQTIMEIENGKTRFLKHLELSKPPDVSDVLK